MFWLLKKVENYLSRFISPISYEVFCCCFKISFSCFKVGKKKFVLKCLIYIFATTTKKIDKFNKLFKYIFHIFFCLVHKKNINFDDVNFVSFSTKKMVGCCFFLLFFLYSILVHSSLMNSLFFKIREIKTLMKKKE